MDCGRAVLSWAGLQIFLILLNNLFGNLFWLSVSAFFGPSGKLFKVAFIRRPLFVIPDLRQNSFNENVLQAVFFSWHCHVPPLKRYFLMWSIGLSLLRCLSTLVLRAGHALLGAVALRSPFSG